MKQQDHIKAFIQAHREAFDTEIPGAYGWESLEKTLQRADSADALELELLCNRPLLDTAEPGSALWARIEAELDAAPAEADPLEQYIRTHREAFDTAEPDLRVWSAIVGATGEAPGASRPAKVVHVNWRQNLLRIAASMALLITGLSIGIWYGRGSAEPAGMAMSQVSTEYAELEQYYQRDITGKQMRLTSLGGNQPGEVIDDLEQLDRIMQELRQELADVPPGNREQVVRAMIENYKAKASILQRVLERLEQNKTDQPAQHAPQHEIENI